jgi:DNA-directed RNA polymerase specialized sigma24 family protein
MSEGFHTTRWTVVRNASGRTPAGREALRELCAAYYAPVVAFLRQSTRDESAARDLAHGFFASLLEKPAFDGAEAIHGRFRSYLLGALKHHLSHGREHHARQKRGGGRDHVPFGPGTDTSPGIDPPDRQTLPPDREFDRQWALHVLRRAMNALSSEWAAAGEAVEFAALRPFIAGDTAHGDLAALAAERAESAATLRKTVSRLRQRFRHHVKACLHPTLGSHGQADEEMRALLMALGGE